MGETFESLKVWRGRHGDPEPLFGPLPAVRAGDVLAYEFELPAGFTPWPGRTRLDRVFVLLDLGIQMCNPCWETVTTQDGREGNGLSTADSWYVDLVTVEETAEGVIVRDFYIDLVVTAPGMPYRTLDIDEFADAIERGTTDVAEAVDGLRRWQRFLDTHINADRNPTPEWTDFPPRAIRELVALPSPLGPPVVARPV
jgi:hypothetical protein